MKHLKKLLIILIALPIIILSGCKDNLDSIDIYATIYPVEYIVKRIVEDDFTVKSVYPRGKDVHDYELGPKEIIKITKSKLLFYIGINLESQIEKSLNSTLKKVKSVCLSEGMELIAINSEDLDEHYHEEDHDDGVFYDPHIWLDLSKMQIITTKVLNTILETFDLTHEQTLRYKENANNLIEDLKQLDQDYFNVINSEDVLSKTIIVDHDAYIYWQARYGLERIRIRNDNESTDAIPKDMLEKIKEAKAKNIKYICLTKNELTSAIAETYRVELGLDKDAFLYLHHLATITAEEEKLGYDYLALMRYNLEILAKALPKK